MVSKLNLFPNHVAIIMDGNRRWAREKSETIAFGHEQGSKKVNEILDFSIKKNISYLTLYAFSSENWRRSEHEIKHLKLLLKKFINDYEKDLIAKNIKFRAIGNISNFGHDLSAQILNLEHTTQKNSGLNLTVALSYGSRDEIVNAVNAILSEKEVKHINEESFAKYLSTSNIPDPDLLIRTGGEVRLSNFLLWQMAYTELYFTKVFWPDFGVDEYEKALDFFASKIDGLVVINTLINYLAIFEFPYYILQK